MLVIEHRGELLLEKRSGAGIWGGLWCFPEVEADADAAIWCEKRLGARVEAMEALPPFVHGFTHFNLTISPQRVRVRSLAPRAAEAVHQWLQLDAAKDAAIPAPVRRILESL